MKPVLRLAIILYDFAYSYFIFFKINFEPSKLLESWKFQVFEKKLLIAISEKLRQSYRGHCVKGVRNRSYSGPFLPAFGLNTERCSVSLRIKSECGRIRARITPNKDTFYVVGVIYKYCLCINRWDGILF